MKIALKFKGYESSRVMDRLRRDARLNAEVKVINGESCVLVKDEFASLGEARDIRRQLLSDFSDFPHADREISVLESEAGGLLSLFEFAARLSDAPLRLEEPEGYDSSAYR